MKYLIWHRPVGEPDVEPGVFEVEAQDKEEAESIFWDCHEDLNAKIISVNTKGGAKCRKLNSHI